MTDPLARIEAMIATLGSRETRFWTPLDTSQEQVSNPKAPENCGFRQFGRFGHPTENTIGDDLVGEHEHAPDGGAKASRVSRASSPIQDGVQSVQSVQRHQNQQSRQPLRFGHLEAASVQNQESGVQNPATERLKRQHPGCVLPPEGTPNEWSEGVALLRNVPAPRGYPQRAWQQLILDAERFLERWAAHAAALGWPAWELFGCHRRASWGRIQGMGLILLLQGDEIAALTATEAVIRTPTGAHQTYRRRPADPLHPAERCLVWELNDG
jgi:hypothetical protein